MFSAAGLFVTFLNIHLNVGRYQAIVAGIALVLTAVQNPDGLTSAATGKGPAAALGKLRDRAAGQYQKRAAGRAAGQEGQGVQGGQAGEDGNGGSGPNAEDDSRDAHHPVV
jgi:hypothetical protein